MDNSEIIFILSKVNYGLRHCTKDTSIFWQK